MTSLVELISERDERRRALTDIQSDETLAVLRVEIESITRRLMDEPVGLDIAEALSEERRQLEQRYAQRSQVVSSLQPAMRVALDRVEAQVRASALSAYEQTTRKERQEAERLLGEAEAALSALTEKFNQAGKDSGVDLEDAALAMAAKWTSRARIAIHLAPGMNGLEAGNTVAARSDGP